MSDDFPAPFGPRIAVCSPGWIVSDRSSSTRTPPRTSVAFFNSSTGSTLIIVSRRRLPGKYASRWSDGAACESRASAPCKVRSHAPSKPECHVDAHLQRVSPAAEDHAANRADVAVVEPLGQRDMTRRRQQIVRGIDIDPAGAGAMKRQPRMRGVRSDAARHSGRGRRLEIAAHVPRGDAERPQAGNLEPREVLAHATTETEDFRQGRRDGRGVRIEREVGVNACRQVDHRVEKRAPRGK